MSAVTPYHPPDTRLLILDAGDRMQETGCRMQDAGCRMQDAGCRMQLKGESSWDSVKGLLGGSSI
jgi:hypothetical protein